MQNDRSKEMKVNGIMLFGDIMQIYGNGYSVQIGFDNRVEWGKVITPNYNTVMEFGYRQMKMKVGDIMMKFELDGEQMYKMKEMIESMNKE